MRLSLLLIAASLSQAATSEFVYESAPFPKCHASTIFEVKPGELLASWFGGSDEGKPDVAIWGSRRVNGKWSVPGEWAREANIATYNPVLFRAADRRLWLYYKFGPHPDNWTAARRFSLDDGKTWSPIEHLPAGLLGPIRAKPLVLADGAIVSGTSVESYRSWAVWIERSVDNGITWSKFGPISVPQTGKPAETGTSEWSRTYGLIQPSIVQLAPRKLRLYARATSMIGKICAADSNDNGITWTQAHPIDLPNPNSGIDAVSLKDGRVVMIYNHTTRGRSPLNLAISRDGEHFTKFMDIETEPGEYSYPALISASDGGLHITYTWRRQRIKYLHVGEAELPK